ncbi:hypothetical protein E8E13_006735 [Curvularia kusanoi]|uniref:Uncharacterized protein n=1 Tax=Curvularia kusanoi TaxID=90978 RepID=A0A9P4WBT3_CURKU|nr:hypothetical protein E8E13_006735 [Curvularia kusanoi]
MLSLPKDEALGSVTSVLRYTRMTEDHGEEYFHTNMLDDVRLLKTEAFKDISKRLDLENTRELHEDEEPVLRTGDKRMGTEPMANSIVIGSVGLFEEMHNADLDRLKDQCSSYQEFPLKLGSLQNALDYKLVTLTIIARGPAETPVQNIRRIHSSLVSFLGTATQELLQTSLYGHNSVAQPVDVPAISEGEHGGGQWVACVLIRGDADEKLLNAGLPGVEGQVEEWSKRVMLDGSLEGVDIKTAVWTGDIFMS